MQVTLNSDVIPFETPITLTPTGSWTSSEFEAFSIHGQAQKGSGLYVTLWRTVNGHLVKITDTLKHMQLTDDGVYLSFDGKRYQVGKVA